MYTIETRLKRGGLEDIPQRVEQEMYQWLKEFLEKEYLGNVPSYAIFQITFSDAEEYLSCLEKDQITLEENYAASYTLIDGILVVCAVCQDEEYRREILNSFYLVFADSKFKD